jgi:creatinine amidohydrolase
MMADGEGIRAHVETTLERLEELGVKTAVVFSGHFAPEQLDVIDRVKHDWNRSGTRTLAVLATAVDRCPTASFRPDHAGVFETTLLAGIAPELVHLEKLPSIDGSSTVDSGEDPFGDHRHDEGHVLWGVFGPDPREADLSRGREFLGELGSWLSGLATETTSRST